ncbi:MAG: hypothetical protein V2A61_00730 [Calditrichota bacterium]
MNQILWILPFWLIGQTAPQDLREDVTLILYNRDQALVRELRTVNLEKGFNRVDFHRIADGVYGHTINIESLEANPGFKTLNVSFHYDLVSLDKLNQRFIGRWFSFIAEDQTYQGRLLSIDDTHLFLQPDTLDPLLQVVEKSKLSEMFYPGVPEGLFIEPTIRWEVEAAKRSTDRPVELTYLTSDIIWMSDYRLEVTGDETAMMRANFTISNDLPLDFPETKVILVAGDIHRTGDPAGSGGDAVSEPAKSGEKGSSEFSGHRFSLPQRINLIGNQTVQVSYLDNRAVKFKKRLVLPHHFSEDRVWVKLEVENTASNNLGIPLPQGDVSIYERDEGVPIFLGEDEVAETAVGSKWKITSGTAFDLTARRTRLAQSRPQRDQHEESWRVELSNSGDKPAIVEVEQRVYGYYEVTNVNVNVNDNVEGVALQPQIRDANLIWFPVTVPSGGKVNLTYSLVYGY